MVTHRWRLKTRIQITYIYFLKVQHSHCNYLVEIFEKYQYVR